MGISSPPSAAFVHYTADLDIFKVEKPYELYQVEGLSPNELSNVVYESRDISQQLENVRGRIDDFSPEHLDSNSFCYMKYPSQVPATAEQDMIYPYASEVNDLLRTMFKTDHVVCYDVRCRMNRQYTADEDASTSRSVPSPPVSLVHTDHTPEGGWSRIRRHLSEEEFEKFHSGLWRARIVNVWRPLKAPVFDSPLGLCDYRTVEASDRIAADHVSALSSVEVFQFKYNKLHHWYYLAGQTVDEICVFVAFDSHPPGTDLNYVPHAAIAVPSCPPGTPPRESIETRTIVFTPLEK